MFRQWVGFASRSGLAVTIATALAAAPSLGQEAASREEWNGKWSASVGIDPTKTDGSLNLSENFAAAIAKQWSRSGSRIGFRAQLSTGREPATLRAFNVLECGDCVLKQIRRYQELSGAAVLTFRNNHSFRPYILGGPGIYRVTTSYFARGVVIGNGNNPSTSSVWSLGLTAGVGASLKLFGKDFFIEQRIIWPQATTGYRTGPVPVPFSIGVKFEK